MHVTRDMCCCRFMDALLLMRRRYPLFQTGITFRPRLWEMVCPRPSFSLALLWPSCCLGYLHLQLYSTSATMLDLVAQLVSSSAFSPFSPRKARHGYRSDPLPRSILEDRVNPQLTGIRSTTAAEGTERLGAKPGLHILVLHCEIHVCEFTANSYSTTFVQ